jgi:hypothetical protein
VILEKVARCVLLLLEEYRTHLTLILALSAGAAAGAGRTSVEHDLLPTSQFPHVG